MNSVPSLGDLWTYFGPTFGAGWGPKPIMPKTPEDFGADPSGLSDSTKALNDWIASATAANPVLVVNAGTYKFTSALNLPTNLNNFCIRGAGPTQSVFKYAGASTTIDLMAGGNFVTNTSGWQLSGFRVASDTTMTAGAGLHLKRMSQCLVDNVFMDATDQTSNQLLWNGFWFDGIHQVGLSNFMVYCGHNGVQLNGFDGASGNDFWLSQGSLTYCTNVGLLIGGNIGIVWCDGLEFIGSGTIGAGSQVRVDNSLNTFGGVGNAGAIFSDTCHFDGLQTNGSYCLEVNDTLISGGNLVINGTIGSAVLDNIHITSWPNSTMFLNGRNFNALRDGVRLSDATTILVIGAAGSVDTNGGYGVNATVPTTKISSWGPHLRQCNRGLFCEYRSSKSLCCRRRLYACRDRRKWDHYGVHSDWLYAPGGEYQIAARLRNHRHNHERNRSHQPQRYSSSECKALDIVSSWQGDGNLWRGTDRRADCRW
jgi:hypothetical protein